MNTADNTPSAEISRVAVRLPPFWPERPAMWFAQAEEQFSLAGICSERTKFFHIISQLDHPHAAEVEDIIISPSKRDPYTMLRAELMRRLTPSKEQRIRQLLTVEEMGDRMPSKFLRHLRGLAPDVLEDFLFTIWASRLPPNIQAFLTCQQERSLDAAACCVDRISEVAPQPALDSVAPTLQQEILEISWQVAALSTERDRLRTRFRDSPLSSRDPYPNSRDPRPGPETAARTADPPPETTQHPPSAGTIVVSEPEPKGVHRPAPTTSRETNAADITGGTCLLHDRPPLRYGEIQ
jgi:hypothetical protein